MDRIAARCSMTLYEGEDAMPRDQLLRDLAGKLGAVTLLTERVDDEFLDAAGPQLAIVANYAVGFDNIDVAACTRRGVLVVEHPRRADRDHRRHRLGADDGRGPPDPRGRPVPPRGHAVDLGTADDARAGRARQDPGIVGFGRIGQAVARRAAGFGMRVIYYDVCRHSPDIEQELGAEYRELDDLLAEADFVSLHTNLTDETRHLIDAERLAQMKPTAVLVNTSRGPVIDEAALADALARARSSPRGSTCSSASRRSTRSCSGWRTPW